MPVPTLRVQKLHILVGRDDEVQLLQDAYQRVSGCPSRTTCEAILVHGDSGTGKTALVQYSFRKHNKVMEKATMVSGKFDEFNTARPFSAIVDALTRLCHKTELLPPVPDTIDDDTQQQTQGQETVTLLKEKIQTRLGPTDLEILCKLVPALSNAFASHAVSALTVDVVENVSFAFSRFAEIVRSFLYTVAGSLEDPLILFLDDVQWADPESLSLIRSLTSLHSACQNLLMILAYRDNEENSITQSKLLSTVTGFQVLEIKLEGLDLNSTNKLVSKTLQMNPEETLPLSDIITKRTGGNIYFVLEFLQMLHREKLLEYSLGTFRWEWNIKKIHGETNVTDNVAFLLMTRIRQLAPDVQSALQLAACLGFYFDIEILERIVHDVNGMPSASGLLVTVMDEPEKEVAKERRDCISDFSRTIELARYENLIDPVKDSKFKFSHDRVQQAAYEMIPAGKEKDLMHWWIGQILWREQRRHETSSPDDWLLFTAADQLNRGSINNKGVINNEETRLSLVRLNLEAGQKAFEKSAFKYAAQFLNHGVQLLGNRWQSDYPLCLEVYTLSAEAEYIQSNFEKCEERVNNILPNSQCLDDKLRAYFVWIETLGARGRIREALDQAVKVLRLLGERVPRRPNTLHVLVELVKVKRALKVRKMSEILSLPDMTNPTKIAAMKILQTVATFSWFAGEQSFLAISSMRMFRLTLQYGICKNSPYAIAAYGIMVGILGDIEMAYEIGKIALELLSRPHTLSCYARSNAVIFTFLHHFKKPLVGCLDNLMEGYNTGMKSGEIEGAAMCLCPYAFAGLYLGKKLGVVVAEIAGFRQTYREEFSRHYTIQSLVPVHQFALNLTGQCENTSILTGDAMSEDSFLRTVRQTGNDVAEEVVHIMRMLLLYILNEVEEANKELPHLDLDASRGTHLAFPFTMMYAGLVLLAMARKTRRRMFLRKADALIRQMKKFAKVGDLNVPPNLELLQAERTSLRRNQLTVDVKKAYDVTMRLAARSGFSIIEAVANERAGEYMFSVGDAYWAESYLARAFFLYGEWGATSKTAQMVDKYSFLADAGSSPQRRYDLGLGDRFSYNNSNEFQRHNRGQSDSSRAGFSVE